MLGNHHNVVTAEDLFALFGYLGEIGVSACSLVDIVYGAGIVSPEQNERVAEEKSMVQSPLEDCAEFPVVGRFDGHVRVPGTLEGFVVDGGAPTQGASVSGKY